MRQLCCFVILAGFALAPSLHAGTDLRISEFMASNGSTLADEDNTYGDWVEIQNVSLTNVNLQSWSLTDNASQLNKWRFPATNLNAGAFMVVWLDGKDRRVPGAPLHASFSLSADGEYLALVRPDNSIATQFPVTYPSPTKFSVQAADVSYGFGTLASNFTVVTSNATVRVQVPTSGADGSAWQLPGFNDSAWIAGTNGVGYGTTNAFAANYALAIAPTAPVVHYRFEETAGAVATNIGSGAGMNGAYNGVTLGSAGPRPPAQNGFEGDNKAPTFNGSSYVAGPAGFFNNRNSFTVGGWVNPTVTPGSRIGLFGQNDCIEFGFISGTTIELWTPGGGSLQVAYPHPLNTWHHIVGVGDGTALRVYIDGVQAGSGGAATASYGSSTYNFNIGGGGIQDATGNFFTGQIDEVVGYQRALSAAEVLSLYQAGTNGTGVAAANFVRTDIGAAMSNVNASAYIRIPFNVPNPAVVSSLTLRIRHDDGFAAYVNGTLVAQANAPASLSYSSAATNTHSPAIVDTFNLGTNSLVAGTNILAIQGLNTAANDTDFLILAELITTSVSEESSTPVYFTVPTPGAPNGSGVANPGPAILAPAHMPTVPLDGEDIKVTARIAQTFYPATNVVMRYRVMFGPEVEVKMYDDGLHGDGATNDGVFGATIPASESTNGQMVRWYFVAQDSLGNSSRWPLFANPVDSAEYLGTVVDPTYVTSKLPIIHLFAPPTVLNPGPTTTQVGADSQNGDYVSVFYDGEFYDHVKMELRGNSTAGFNKKSHRLDFNREHPFRHLPGYPRLRKTSFTADWPDQTYMRQELSFWLADQMGAPAPFYYPVRLQLNGQFYQLANHNDVHTDEYLDRIGYDPNGALYNAAGQVTEPPQSTGGFDKKTRKWDVIAGSNPPRGSDYTNMAIAVAATDLTQRRINAYELFDIPEMLNYLVVARWAHENDDVWANMSMYKDNDGDGLWRILPFDMNLSWGAIFAEGDASLYTGVQATNDTHKAHPLYGGQNIQARSGPAGAYNRIYDTFFKVPELRQMFLRRMRTLLDTHIKPPGTPAGATALEQRIYAARDAMAEDARLDRIWWGWPAVGGQNNFSAPANSDPFGSANRTNAAMFNLSNAVNDMITQFIYPRRTHFYSYHSVTNTRAPLFNELTSPASNTVAGIPGAQSPNAIVLVGAMEFNPSTGNQGQEYIQLTNPNPVAIDISGWKLGGGVEFTFKPGTVILATNSLYVSPDRNAFRTRTTGPRPNLGLFVVGNYNGQLSARGETVTLTDDTGRLVSTNAYPGNPSTAQRFLRITEIMYNPGPTNVGSPYAQQEYEYIELKNIGTNALNLVGIHFTNGIEFAFATNSAMTNLNPGQRVVLVKNAAAFISRYGSAPIAGIYTGTLDSNGERVTLVDAVNEEIMDFTYDNSWYPITDGLGFSLVVVDENANPDAWNSKSNWRASGSLNGSPGAAEPAPAAFPEVVITEVLANSTLPNVDAVELSNLGTNPANIGGWYLSDDFFTPKKYRLTNGTTIAPGQQLVLTEAQFNPTPGTPPSFAFSSYGDEVFLFAADLTGNLLGYYHGFDFKASAENVSFGRYIDSQTNEHFVAQATNTLGAPNSLPRVGPIVISEIMYHPPDLNGSDDSQNEFIELYNITTNSVVLADATYPTNAWKLKDAVDFKFATNTTIPPGGYLLVVGFDPATNATALAAFRDKYALSPSVAVVGPYKGQLDNSGNNVELAAPLPPTINGIEYFLVDKVDYRDSAPWATSADGVGPSLQRLVCSDFGNDPTNWVAALPTPGAAFGGGVAPVILQQPQSLVLVEGQTTNLTIVASGPDLHFQWRFGDAFILDGTNATLPLVNVSNANSGIYSVSVFNQGGSAASISATVMVRFLPVFLSQPTSQTNLPGSNTVFSALATGTGPLRYQWRKDGTNIANATNATLALPNVQLDADAAIYDVTATDDVGTAVSAPAYLVVKVNPYMLVTPGATNVVLQGGSTTFYISAGPVHRFLPLMYRYLPNPVGMGGYTNNTSVFYSNNFFIITNAVVSGTLRVVLQNPVAQQNITAQSAGAPYMLVLADNDRDGMADAWEVRYGFNTNNIADASEDLDGDGMINRDEYVAGTDPANALSVLKLSFAPTNSSILQFQAESNISYSIQIRTNLNTGWQNWSNVNASNTVRSIQFPDPQTNSERFFRIVTPQVR